MMDEATAHEVGLRQGAGTTVLGESEVYWQGLGCIQGLLNYLKGCTNGFVETWNLVFNRGLRI